MANGRLIAPLVVITMLAVKTTVADGFFRRNLALLCPANQSSTHGWYEASNAVDGTDSESVTNGNDLHPWWKVQLAYPVWVSQVEIESNPSYACNFEIRVGQDGQNIENNELCFKLLGSMTSSSAKFTCSPTLWGNWISVKKSATCSNYLVLHEVRVFSSKKS